MKGPMAAFDRIAETEKIASEALGENPEINEIAMNRISPRSKKRK